MAGTTVQEGGIVYRTLQSSMQKFGLDVSDEAMEPWHGAKKEAVIEHFARIGGVPDVDLESRILEISDDFVEAIDEAYFSEASSISHVDERLLDYFKKLQESGVKIGLNTGYPKNIQEGLVKKLGFDTVVDCYISSYEVRDGRPFPYMIHRLMEQTGVETARRVCKVGDSVRDIEEGINARCGLVVGVLTGADSRDALLAAGADVVVDCITDLPIPRQRSNTKKFRLPDLS